MRDYFRLQYVLTNRKIKEAGLNPLWAYVLGLTAFILLSEYLFHKTELAKYLIILTCLGLQFKLSGIGRRDFLLLTFGDNQKKSIRILENVILSIPFVLFLVYKSLIVESITLLVGSIILAFSSFHSRSNLTIPTPFSKRPYEFSTGFRKTFFIFPLAYALTVLAVNVDNLNLGIFAFLLIFLVALSYYHRPEHEFYVWVHAETPQVFLRNKIFSASKNITLLATPIIISLLIFYPSKFDLIIICYFMGLLFLWTIILAKYSAYPREMNLPEGIMILLCIYFPPLLLLIIPLFYRKSIRKLKYLLND